MDFEPYVDRIKQQIDKYGFTVKEVGIDGGYDFEEVHKEMFDLGIKTYVPPKNMEKITSDRIYPPSALTFDETKNVYICPNNCELRYSSVDKHERKKVYSARKKN